MSGKAEQENILFEAGSIGPTDLALASSINGLDSSSGQKR